MIVSIPPPSTNPSHLPGQRQTVLKSKISPCSADFLLSIPRTYMDGSLAASASQVLNVFAIAMPSTYSGENEVGPKMRIHQPVPLNVARYNDYHWASLLLQCLSSTLVEKIEAEREDKISWARSVRSSLPSNVQVVHTMALVLLLRFLLFTLPLLLESWFRLCTYEARWRGREEK